MEELRSEISNIIKETFLSEELPQMVAEKPNKSKAQAVRFNPGLENEYVVTFSERGFLIANTRMSFEEIKTAISKEYTITLKDGTVLDAVKMQQILKYENRY